MPAFTIDSVDLAPPELAAQLPIRGELRCVIPGPDRPDYCLATLDTPIVFRPPADFDLSRVETGFLGRDEAGPFVYVPAVIVAARIAGQQLHPGMKGLQVALAYVIDNTIGRDDVVDFAKLHYAAVAVISDVP